MLKKLIEKLQAEQKAFRDFLLTKSAAEILDYYAFQYTVREDILCAMESCDLSDKQAEALLRLPDTLSELYRCYGKMDTSCADLIQIAAEELATA